MNVRSSRRRSSLKKGVLKNFAKFTGKHVCLSRFLETWKFAKILRTPVLKNICERPLLRCISFLTEAYIAVSGGQIIAIEMPPTTANGVHPTTAEEVASSALTDMADRATIELAAGQSNNGTVTIRASDGSVSTIPSSLISQ